MKLTKEKVKEIIAKVHKDLSLTHSDKYPIECGFVKKGVNPNRFDFDIWTGGYDYSDPEAVGDDSWGKYPEYIISIDDQKGEAIAYHYYTGHVEIRLNKMGKYEEVKQMYRS